MKAIRVLVVIAACAGAAYWGLLVHTPPGPRSLGNSVGPDVADTELAMWQAYYDKRKFDLFALLVKTLRHQYRYPWSKATGNAYRFARAAARFGDMRDRYDDVLPDLEDGYATIREWTGGAFDVHAVARAELAWWVARRTKGESSPENVGRLIGREYAMFYGVEGEGIERAGLLRAQAAALRDAGGVRADWTVIGEMLRESYAALSISLGRTGAGVPASDESVSSH